MPEGTTVARGHHEGQQPRRGDREGVPADRAGQPARRSPAIFGDAAWGNKERLPESSLLGPHRRLQRADARPGRPSPTTCSAPAYEYLLKKFADESGKKAGEFFTPRAVVRLLVGILDPQPGETVYDPACGSGGMLVETINEVRDHGRRSPDAAALRPGGQPHHRRRSPA